MFSAAVVAGALTALPLGFEIDLAEARPPAWTGRPSPNLNFVVRTADGGVDRRFWFYPEAEVTRERLMGHLPPDYAVRPVGKTKLVFTAHKGSRIVGAWFYSTDAHWRPDGKWSGTVRRVVVPPEAPKK